MADVLLHRTQRRHNLLNIVVVIVGLVCLLGARMHWVRAGFVTEPARSVLVIVRLAVPAVMLLVTALFTNVKLTGAGRRADSAAALTASALAPVFCRCKSTTMLLLTAAGLFADAQLLFEPRWLALLLVLLPLAVLIGLRPTHGGLAAFTGLAGGGRHDGGPVSAVQGSAASAEDAEAPTAETQEDAAQRAEAKAPR